MLTGKTNGFTMPSRGWAGDWELSSRAAGVGCKLANASVSYSDRGGMEIVESSDRREANLRPSLVRRGMI